MERIFRLLIIISFFTISGSLLSCNDDANPKKSFKEAIKSYQDKYPPIANKIGEYVYLVTFQSTKLDTSFTIIRQPIKKLSVTKSCFLFKTSDINQTLIFDEDLIGNSYFYNTLNSCAELNEVPEIDIKVDYPPIYTYKWTCDTFELVKIDTLSDIVR